MTPVIQNRFLPNSALNSGRHLCDGLFFKIVKMRKNNIRPLVFLLLLACTTAGWAQPGGWTVKAADYQFSMNMVVQIDLGGNISAAPDNHLAVFFNNQIRGYAVPVQIGGQVYFFLNIYSNTYLNDSLYFLAFIGAEQRIYESTDTVVFLHHQLIGTIADPYILHFQLGTRPLIFSLAEIEYAESNCLPDFVTDVQASDDVDVEGDSLKYDISGGADAAFFAIDSVTGVLTWQNFFPDFENPADADGNNIYLVQVRVRDRSGKTSTQDIAVRITDSPAPTAVCPPALTVHTSDDGPGDCIVVPETDLSVSIPSNCATNQIAYQLEGAMTGQGSGQVPINLAFGIGQTVVHYTVADDAGTRSSTCSFTIEVVDDEPPAIACPANQAVPHMYIAPCSALVTGIDAVSSDNCSGVLLQYELSGATTGAGNGLASGLVFNTGLTTVAYMATDEAGRSSTCSFTVSVSSCNLEFSGNIYWEEDGTSGVGNATVNLTGGSIANAHTDNNGQYLIAIPPTSGNFSLKPIKNINNLNGVTVADATAIQQHVTLINPIVNPFKLIAADVNRDNTISTFDALLIKQSLLGSPAANNIFNVSWRFTPMSWTPETPPWGFPETIDLAGVSSNQSGLDFYGVKIGDVVMTYANPAGFGAEAPGLTLQTPEQVLKKDAVLEAEFRADPFQDLNGFQFALRFDMAVLQFEGIEPLGGLPLLLDNFGTYHIDQGEIRTVWVPDKPAQSGEAAAVFRLRFKALESGVRLSEALWLDDSGLAGIAYNSAYAESTVALRFPALSAGAEPGEASMALALENRPNPFVDKTVLRFELPEAGEVQLRVSDARGRLLYSHRARYPAGWQEEVFDRSGDPGVLFCELLTSCGSLIRKMVRTME